MTVMRPLLPVLLAASLLPATAADAAWRELPDHVMPDGGAAACLRVSGDRVALIEQRGVEIGSALLALSPAGFAPAGPIDLGRSPLLCPELGAAPGGNVVVTAPLLSVPTTAGFHVDLTAAAPARRAQTLTRALMENTTPAVVATARGGSAVVAWVERRRGSSRLLAAHRPAATAPFGAPQPVATGIALDSDRPLLAVDDAGRATLAWQTRRGSAGLVANVARAVPGGAFGAPQRLGPTDWNDLSLAVAGDGRALVAASDDCGVGDDHEELAVAWETASPLAPFARVAVEAPAETIGAVALAADGAAVLATVEEKGLAVWRRPAGGAFGGREAIGVGRAPRRSRIDTGWFSGGRGDDSDGSPLSVRLAPSGRFLLTWAVPAVGAEPGRAAAVSGTLAGGIDGRRRLGNVCRTVSDAAATLLADGTVAAVWADDGTVSTLGDREERRSAGRVGAVTPGAAPPAAAPALSPPAAPRVVARLLGDGRLGATEPLRLRVRCVDGPCEVRASAWVHGVRGRGLLDRRTWAASAASASLAAGRQRTLRLRALPRSAFVSPRDGGTPAITLSTCAARGNAARTTTLRPRLHGRPLPPPPRIVAFDVRRRGDGLRVSWRLSKPLGRGGEWSIEYGDGSHTGGVTGPGQRATRFAQAIRHQGPGPLRLRLSTRLAADVAARETRVR
jgi:hypothetical protein